MAFYELFVRRVCAMQANQCDEYFSTARTWTASLSNGRCEPVNKHTAGQDSEWTAERVRDFVLAFPGSDIELIETLALGLADCINQRDTYLELLRLALAQLSEAHDEQARLRLQLGAVRVELRAAHLNGVAA